MEQEITQNARRRRKIWRYIRGETAKKHIFRACSELHFFLSFTLVYRVLVAMHKTHLIFSGPPQPKKSGLNIITIVGKSGN